MELLQSFYQANIRHQLYVSDSTIFSDGGFLSSFFKNMTCFLNKNNQYMTYFKTNKSILSSLKKQVYFLRDKITKNILERRLLTEKVNNLRFFVSNVLNIYQIAGLVCKDKKYIKNQILRSKKWEKNKNLALVIGQ